MLFLFACSPIEAPEDFDTLNSYLFEHFQSPVSYPETGMENLLTWVPTNIEDLQEGFKIQDLSVEAMATVSDIIPDELIGVAAAVVVPYSVEEIARLHFAYDPMDFYEDTESHNYREYLTDPDCFLAKECEFLSYQSEMKEILPLDIEAISLNATEIRWVTTSMGDSYIQRRWARELPVVNVDWAEVLAEYAFIITVPQADGSSLRIEASWIDLRLGDVPIGEDLGVQLGLNALKDSMGKTEQNLDSIQ